MSTLRVTVVLLAATLLTACAEMQDRPKQTAGTLLGAGLGALAGSQIGGGKGQLAAVAIGTLAGAWMGSEVGKSLDKADRLYAQRTTQDALEYNKSGTPASWSNPDSGNSGTTVPTRTYKTAEGKYCREFETTISIQGKSEKAYGTACREPDGTWRIVR